MKVPVDEPDGHGGWSPKDRTFRVEKGDLIELGDEGRIIIEAVNAEVLGDETGLDAALQEIKNAYIDEKVPEASEKLEDLQETAERIRSAVGEDLKGGVLIHTADDQPQGSSGTYVGTDEIIPQVLDIVNGRVKINGIKIEVTDTKGKALFKLVTLEDLTVTVNGEKVILRKGAVIEIGKGSKLKKVLDTFSGVGSGASKVADLRDVLKPFYKDDEKDFENKMKKFEERFSAAYGAVHTKYGMILLTRDMFRNPNMIQPEILHTLLLGTAVEYERGSKGEVLYRLELLDEIDEEIVLDDGTKIKLVKGDIYEVGKRSSAKMVLDAIQAVGLGHVSDKELTGMIKKAFAELYRDQPREARQLSADILARYVIEKDVAKQDNEGSPKDHAVREKDNDVGYAVAYNNEAEKSAKQGGYVLTRHMFNQLYSLLKGEKYFDSIPVMGEDLKPKFDKNNQPVFTIIISRDIFSKDGQVAIRKGAIIEFGIKGRAILDAMTAFATGDEKIIESLRKDIKEWFRDDQAGNEDAIYMVNNLINDVTKKLKDAKFEPGYSFYYTGKAQPEGSRGGYMLKANEFGDNYSIIKVDAVDDNKAKSVGYNRIFGEETIDASGNIVYVLKPSSNRTLERIVNGKPFTVEIVGGTKKGTVLESSIMTKEILGTIRNYMIRKDPQNGILPDEKRGTDIKHETDLEEAIYKAKDKARTIAHQIETKLEAAGFKRGRGFIHTGLDQGAIDRLAQEKKFRDAGIGLRDTLTKLEDKEVVYRYYAARTRNKGVKEGLEIMFPKYSDGQKAFIKAAIERKKFKNGTALFNTDPEQTWTLEERRNLRDEVKKAFEAKDLNMEAVLDVLIKNEFVAELYKVISGSKDRQKSVVANLPQEQKDMVTKLLDKAVTDRQAKGSYYIAEWIWDEIVITDEEGKVIRLKVRSELVPDIAGAFGQSVRRFLTAEPIKIKTLEGNVITIDAGAYIDLGEYGREEFDDIQAKDKWSYGAEYKENVAEPLAKARIDKLFDNDLSNGELAVTIKVDNWNRANIDFKIREADEEGRIIENDVILLESFFKYLVENSEFTNKFGKIILEVNGKKGDSPLTIDLLTEALNRSNGDFVIREAEEQEAILAVAEGEAEGEVVTGAKLGVPRISDILRNVGARTVVMTEEDLKKFARLVGFRLTPKGEEQNLNIEMSIEGVVYLAYHNMLYRNGQLKVDVERDGVREKATILAQPSTQAKKSNLLNIPVTYEVLKQILSEEGFSSGKTKNLHLSMFQPGNDEFGRLYFVDVNGNVSYDEGEQAVISLSPQPGLTPLMTTDLEFNLEGMRAMRELTRNKYAVSLNDKTFYFVDATKEEYKKLRDTKADQTAEIEKMRAEKKALVKQLKKLIEKYPGQAGEQNEKVEAKDEEINLKQDEIDEAIETQITQVFELDNEGIPEYRLYIFDDKDKVRLEYIKGPDFLISEFAWETDENMAKKKDTTVDIIRADRVAALFNKLSQLLKDKDPNDSEKSKSMIPEPLKNGFVEKLTVENKKRIMAERYVASLTRALERMDLYDYVVIKKKIAYERDDSDLHKEIKDLADETASYRSLTFADLTYKERIAMRKLNRKLMEALAKDIPLSKREGTIHKMRDDGTKGDIVAYSVKGVGYIREFEHAYSIVSSTFVEVRDYTRGTINQLIGVDAYGNENIEFHDKPKMLPDGKTKVLGVVIVGRKDEVIRPIYYYTREKGIYKLLTRSGKELTSEKSNDVVGWAARQGTLKAELPIEMLEENLYQKVQELTKQYVGREILTVRRAKELIEKHDKSETGLINKLERFIENKTVTEEQTHVKRFITYDDIEVRESLSRALAEFNKIDTKDPVKALREAKTYLKTKIPAAWDVEARLFEGMPMAMESFTSLDQLKTRIKDVLADVKNEVDKWNLKEVAEAKAYLMKMAPEELKMITQKGGSLIESVGKAEAINTLIVDMKRDADSLSAKIFGAKTEEIEHEKDLKKKQRIIAEAVDVFIKHRGKADLVFDAIEKAKQIKEGKNGEKLMELKARAKDIAKLSDDEKVQLKADILVYFYPHILRKSHEGPFAGKEIKTVEDMETYLKELRAEPVNLFDAYDRGMFDDEDEFIDFVSSRPHLHYAFRNILTKEENITAFKKIPERLSTLNLIIDHLEDQVDAYYIVSNRLNDYEPKRSYIVDKINNKVLARISGVPGTEERLIDFELREQDDLINELTISKTDRKKVTPNRLTIRAQTTDRTYVLEDVYNRAYNLEYDGQDKNYMKVFEDVAGLSANEVAGVKTLTQSLTTAIGPGVEKILKTILEQQDGNVDMYDTMTFIKTRTDIEKIGTNYTYRVKEDLQKRTLLTVHVEHGRVLDVIVALDHNAEGAVIKSYKLVPTVDKKYNVVGYQTAGLSEHVSLKEALALGINPLAGAFFKNLAELPALGTLLRSGRTPLRDASRMKVRISGQPWRRSASRKTPS